MTAAEAKRIIHPDTTAEALAEIKGQNANFDVLTATLRDGIESVKTTIRKGQK